MGKGAQHLDRPRFRPVRLPQRDSTLRTDQREEQFAARDLELGDVRTVRPGAEVADQNGARLGPVALPQSNGVAPDSGPHAPVVGREKKGASDRCEIPRKPVALARVDILHQNRASLGPVAPPQFKPRRFRPSGEKNG